ncbi:hypothetical protein Y695_04570 [Hydrogenophaga sp. T4]|nr:hypothetical protein Y695_04570 [Hydrogenophaga sp. T4]
MAGGRLQADIGYVNGQAPSDASYRPALDAELSALATCLGVERN